MKLFQAAFGIIIFLTLGAFTHPINPGRSYFIGNTGKVKFVSNAPLEIIMAESNKLLGAIDFNKRTFAFKIPNTSFQGFNSPLQQVHFNENYMESEKHPVSSFAGKIIEDIDLSIPGTYMVRAKGLLKIHGIEKEKIIKSKIVVTNEKIIIRSSFKIQLEEHNIRIPKILNQKIATEVIAEVTMILLPQWKN